MFGFFVDMGKSPCRSIYYIILNFISNNYCVVPSYTEAENPNHLVVVMNGAMPMHTSTTAALLPTAEEYTLILHDAVTTKAKAKPNIVSIDAQEVVALFQQVVEPSGIRVFYYPPPSEEECAITHGTTGNKVRCALCKATHRPDGGKFLTCARCGTVHYCCKEHKKADWKRHKKSCI